MSIIENSTSQITRHSQEIFQASQASINRLSYQKSGSQTSSSSNDGFVVLFSDNRKITVGQFQYQSIKTFISNYYIATSTQNNHRQLVFLTKLYQSNNLFSFCQFQIQFCRPTYFKISLGSQWII